MREGTGEGIEKKDGRRVGLTRDVAKVSTSILYVTIRGIEGSPA